MADEVGTVDFQGRERVVQRFAEIVGRGVRQALHASAGVAEHVNRPHVAPLESLGVRGPDQGRAANAVEEHDRFAAPWPPIGTGRAEGGLDVDGLWAAWIFGPQLVLHRPEPVLGLRAAPPRDVLSSCHGTYVS